MKRIAAVALALSVLPAGAQPVYDLLLKGGHVIDPKNGRNQRLDIAITGDRVTLVAPGIPAVQARTVVTLNDYYVTPGLIDLNAHVYPRVTPEGIDPDHNTLRFGVTTVVDAGSADPSTFEQFRRDVISEATVRVLAILKSGDGAAAVMKKYPETIVGVRGTADLAKTSAGDIQTRIYSRPVGAPTKGVIYDVGHGADGFLFRIAAPAIKQGFLPDTISTGLDSGSVLVPRPTMTGVLSRFLALGMTLDQVVERTTVNPARAIGRGDIGSIEQGGVADIAVFELRRGRFAFVDGAPSKLTADKELRCVLTIRQGKVVWDTEGLSLTDWQHAGPYSNFK